MSGREILHRNRVREKRREQLREENFWKRKDNFATLLTECFEESKKVDHILRKSKHIFVVAPTNIKKVPKNIPSNLRGKSLKSEEKKKNSGPMLTHNYSHDHHINQIRKEHLNAWVSSSLLGRFGSRVSSSTASKPINRSRVNRNPGQKVTSKGRERFIGSLARIPEVDTPRD